MRLIFALALVLTLAACGESPEAAAEREKMILDAVAFTADRPEGVGVAVFGNKIVVNIENRDDNFGNLVREIALAASKTAPSKMLTIYVIDGAEIATEVPEKSVCTVSASDSRIQGNNC